MYVRSDQPEPGFRMRRKRLDRKLLRTGTAPSLPFLMLTLVITWPVHQSRLTTGSENSQNQPQVTTVQVLEGRSQFCLAPGGSKSRYLVVASALARKGGPFPIRLTARPAENWVEPTIANQPAKPARERSIYEGQPEAASHDPVPPPPRRTFTILVREGDPASPGNYESVSAHLRAVGQQVQVYVATEDLPLVAPETLRDIVSTFDQKIWPQAKLLFGPARDVDRDGRFTILLTSWLGRFASGRQSLDGYVRGADFDLKTQAPLGNGCDLLYLNAKLKAGPHLRTILAHEYTHAVVFSRKVLDTGNAGAGKDEEDWLDEALAHLTEDLHGFSRTNLEHRVRAFLTRPERYHLLVEDYFQGHLLRSHGHRGATYLFLRWCQQNYGPDLLPSLVTSPRKGVNNLESGTGEAFETLFRRWSVELVAGPLWNLERNTPGAEEGLPTLHWVRAGGETDCWSAEATTTHYTVLESTGSNPIAVELTAPREADLQVSVVPLPDDYPHLELQPADRSSPGQIRHLGGSSVHIESVRFEPTTHRQANEASRESTYEWKRQDLERIFGPELTVDPGETITLTHPTMQATLNSPQQIIVRGTDPHGVPVYVQVDPISQ